MRNTLKDYLRKVKLNKKHRIESISVLLVLSLFVSGNVFWLLRQTGMTLGTDQTTGQQNSIEAESMSSSNASPSFILETCDCGNEGKAAEHHADSCAYKGQLQKIAADYTTEEILDIWTMLTVDARDYILMYLSWNDSNKQSELKDLVENAGLTDLTIRTSCGEATFSVRGNIPENAVLEVTDPRYSEEKKISFVNPNIQTFVNWSMVYDITIKSDGKTFEPTSAVAVTVKLPTMTSDDYDPDTMYFYVVHLDETTGEELGKERVDVIDGNITFTATGFSPYLFYSIDMESEGGEMILGTNWMDLRDSDYFTYWEQFISASQTTSAAAKTNLLAVGNKTNSSNYSSTQIDYTGETTKSEHDDGVEVSKTIAGTEIENVFDITLTVKTNQNIQKIYQEPDMAVVIVMDISNTMLDNFGNVSRYQAAMEAAEKFIDKFTAETGGVSRIGYVAFNTDAHKIFDLTTCSTDADANNLKNQMRQKTGNIINANDYGSAHSRFTNIEAGLKMGYDMLQKAKNEHKYIIFLSDGFPTTYISNGYIGYDPYTSSGNPKKDGVFYDYVSNTHCDYGASYSDKAAIRAREKATEIKNAGVSIFSIGVNIGGQTIDKYDNHRNDSFSVIDRTSEKYEIGSANSTEAYKNWLRDKIGSGDGYYYDSTNADGLKAAYDDIFKKIIQEKIEGSKADWVTEDPIPVTPPEYIEFIGFYDKNNNLLGTDKNLEGEAKNDAENTAVFDASDDGKHTITWDLKASGFQTWSEGVTVYYSYKLVYRVRLKNELNGFVENKIYDTNDKTTLTYKVFEETNGVQTLSEQRTIDFTIPRVHGYLADLTFKKVDSDQKYLAGALFTLTHDNANCTICRGDRTIVKDFPTYTATSDVNGNVKFENIPSGHKYILQESKAPPGYIRDNTQYSVTVAYDKLTWDEPDVGQIVNRFGAEFPSTGGIGTKPYIFTGVALIVTSVVCGYIHRRKRGRRAED